MMTKSIRLRSRCVSVEGFSDTEQLMELPKEKEYFIAVYLQDVTELNRISERTKSRGWLPGWFTLITMMK